MPQPSNPTSAEGSLLAARYDRTVNLYVSRFDTLTMMLSIELDRAASERDSRRAMDAFIAALILLLTDAEDNLGGELPRYMLSLWGVGSVAFKGSQKISQYAEALRNFSERKLEDTFQIAAVASVSTGGDVPATLSAMVSAPSFRVQLHRNADFLLSSLGQQAILEAGEPHFARKMAVGVADDRQSRICRRMDGQVVDWGDYFVDPLSHARWLAPPFIYGGLPPDESWHPCRTSVSPV
jgi:hypothetical protein